MDNEVRNFHLKKASVLVTAVGAPGAVNIIQALGKNGEREISVFGVDVKANPSGKPFVDGFRQVPPGKSGAFVDAIISVCNDFGIDVVIPLSTEELLAFAANREQIEGGSDAKVCVSPEESIRISNDKANLFEKLASKHVPIPRFSVADSMDDFSKAIKGLLASNERACMKPAFAHGGRGFRIISREKDTTKMLLESKPENSPISLQEAERLIKGLREMPRMLVMEFLPGKEYSVDALCSDGDLLVAVPRSRDEIRSGISFVGTVERNEEAIQISKALCDVIKFDGPVGIQLKQASDGRLKVLEVNPRLHGSVVLTVAAGVNIPYLAVKNTLKEEFEIPTPKYGTGITRYWGASFHDQDGLSYTL